MTEQTTHGTSDRAHPGTEPTTARPDQLPAAIQGFLDAHRVRDVDAALPAFTADAVVTDQGRTFRGTEEVARFLRESGAEFTYTTEVVGAERTDEGRWVVTTRIVGDFPGGVAHLRYRISTAGGLIRELHIGA